VSKNQIVQEEARQSWWISRWATNETFWQGIVIQTTGTLAAAAILAIVAIVSGVGYTPAIRYFVVYGLYLVLLLLIAAIGPQVAYHYFKRWIMAKFDNAPPR
jgi:hypothetical protein